MSRKTKIWLVTAAALVLVGCALFANVMALLEWDFTKLSTTEYETNEYQINDSYENISVVTNTANVKFIVSENEESSVVCREEKNAKHTVTVKDNTLLIEVVDNKQWYEHIGVNFGSPKISVYIPQREYATLSVNNSTGKITLNDLRCKNVILNSSTGNVVLNDVIASEKISVKISTGNVSFENCDANEIFVCTNTGNVKGNLLSEKVFVAQTDTGKIDVPNTTNGGKCEITTDTGNIKITVEKK